VCRGLSATAIHDSGDETESGFAILPGLEAVVQRVHECRSKAGVSAGVERSGCLDSKQPPRYWRRAVPVVLGCNSARDGAKPARPVASQWFCSFGGGRVGNKEAVSPTWARSPTRQIER